MKKTLLYTVITFLLSFSSIAGNTEPVPKRIYSGKVLDRQSGEALAGVKIHVKDTDTTFYTDLEGKYFLLLDPKPGTEISLELVGYAPLKISCCEAGADNELKLSPR